MSAPNTAQFNIQRVIAIDLDAGTPALQFDGNGNFVDEAGFFIRVETTGYLRYCPIGNTDAEAIEKNFIASTYFVDAEVCRKIFSTLSTGSQQELAEVIYVGYGV